jgi:hypothetical protein
VSALGGSKALTPQREQRVGGTLTDVKNGDAITQLRRFAGALWS